MDIEKTIKKKKEKIQKKESLAKIYYCKMVISKHSNDFKKDS